MFLDFISNHVLASVFWMLIIFVLANVFLAIGYICYVMKTNNPNPFTRGRFIAMEISFVAISAIISEAFFSSDYSKVIDNGSLFLSYKEAIFEMDVTLRFILGYNVVLFIPIGVLLPIIFKKTDKYWMIFAITMISSIVISILQYVLGLGSFNVDNLFNYCLGVLIGYGLYRLVNGLCFDKEKKKLYTYTGLIPIGFTALVIITSVIVYCSMDYGINSYICYKETDMSDVKVESKIEFSDTVNTGHIGTFDKCDKSVAELEKICSDFLSGIVGKLSTETEKKGKDYVEVHTPEWQQVVSIDKSGTKVIFEYVDNDNESLEEAGVSDPRAHKMVARYDDTELKELIIKELKKLDIDLDLEKYEMERDKFSCFFTYTEVQEKCEIKKDVTIGLGNVRDLKINSVNVEYETVDYIDEVKLYSEKEAYELLKKGRFSSNYDIDKSIKVLDVSLEYIKDSKGYAIPVYMFECIADNRLDTLAVIAYK